MIKDILTVYVGIPLVLAVNARGVEFTTSMMGILLQWL